MGPDSSRRRFAEFSYDPISGELTREGRLIALEYQPSLVLSRLVLEAGTLVTRDELSASLWDEQTHVNYDDGLNYCVRKIRAALGDDARTPRFIETIPRRGYRFIAPVTSVSTPPVRSWPRLVPALAAALVIVAAVIEWQPNNHHETAVTIVRTVHDLFF